MNLADIFVSNFSGTWADTWVLNLQSRATGRIVGKATYCSAQQPGALQIEIDHHILKAQATNGDFLSGGGTIDLNGRRIALFKTPYPSDFHIQFTDVPSQELRTSMDGWARRFRWAWRLGCSWWDSRRYAAWGERVTGSDYILASPLNIMSSRKYTLDLPFLNEADASIVETLPLQEQLCILVILLRKLCGKHLHLRNQNRVLASAQYKCPNIPSTVNIFRSKEEYLSCNPNDLTTPRSFKLRLGEYVSTGHPLCKSVIVSALTGLCLTSHTGVAALFGITAGTSWLLMIILTKIDKTDKATQCVGCRRQHSRNTSPPTEIHP